MVVKSLKVVSFWTIYGSCLDLTLTQEGHSVASSNDLKMENNVFSLSALFSSSKTNNRRRMFHLEIVES